MIGQHTDTATASGSFTDGAGNTEEGTDTDDANYYGMMQGQPSIQIESLTISINSTRTKVTGQFTITDQSTSAKNPDGYLVAIYRYGVRWEQLVTERKTKTYKPVVPSGCTYTLVSMDGVTYNRPLADGEVILMDEDLTIGYTCTFGSTQLIKGSTLKGTAYSNIHFRTGMEFTYSSTATIPR